MAGFKLGIIVISLACLLSLLYGIIFTVIEEEKNLCRMTYMFDYPQFVKINFEQNKYFPKYGLYVYSEGALTERTRSMDFTGAPVIFVPGNSGSYKQVRSLASVAIRKGIDNGWNQHLDYFTIDFNEEYSALFGGYLETQQNYLKTSIETVLNLYRKLKNPPRQVILIGHSMGGKIAESLLANEKIEPLINTIISLASPIDKPVINLDSHFNSFYGKIGNFLNEHRSSLNESEEFSKNVCHHWDNGIKITKSNESLLLDDKLLISIGGGSRDFLVNSALTMSKSYDINVLTTSVPNVWLTTDHLCSVWCLQLVLVINRFLHSIIVSNNKNRKFGQHFISDKSIRLAKAYNFFVRPETSNFKNRDITFSGNSMQEEWIEDSRRVYSTTFNSELNKTSIQMIRLVDSPNHNYLAVTAINLDNDDWIFGCAAFEVNKDMRFCSKAKSLTHFAERFPTQKLKKSIILLNLHKIKKNFSNWTHVLLRTGPRKHREGGFHIDIFDPAYRFIKINTPKWYSFSQNTAIEETLVGSSFYKLEISGLDEAYQSIAIHIKPRICSKEYHHTIVKTCIPWIKGCEKYQHFSNIENQPIYLNVPITKPSGYNSTNNAISVYAHLDPNCRYTITYQNSFGGTLSQIGRHYIHWLPAHLVSILLMAFRHQIGITPDGNYEFKSGKLRTALLSSSSFFVVTTTRIFAKLLMGLQYLPDPDNFNHSMIISVIIHGSAFAILFISTTILWLLIYFYGNMGHKIILRIIKLPIPSITDSVMPFIEKVPISAGILLTSIANASCSGIALVCGCLMYFMYITIQYENYLEDFVFHTAKMIAEKIFGKKNESKAEEIVEEIDNNKELEEKKEDELVLNSMKKEITAKSEILINTLENSSDTDFPENVTDEELDKLLADAIDKQTNLMKEKKLKEELERAEYDSVHESFSSINFHMTLFMLLCFLTLLNLPSTISWSKNFTYNQRLSPDPSLIPACISLISISIIWQFSTKPRNLKGYNILSYFIYFCAASCILFCQDSVYRLNIIICVVFIVVMLHQIFGQKKPIIVDDSNSANDELQEKIEKIKSLLSNDGEDKDKE